MWSHNPVSPARFDVLLKSAQKHINKDANREWYNWNQQHPNASPEQQQAMQTTIEAAKAHHWRQLQGQLQHLGNADPTSSGQYGRWILDLILKKNITLPEDAEKVRDLLEDYHRIKGKLPIAQRQIKYFKTYQNLRQTIVPLLPQLRSRAELQREGMVLIASEIVNDAKYDIYQLTTVEATTRAAKKTGWCVCNADTAKFYLTHGPLFLVMRDGLRHTLAHIDIDDPKDAPSDTPGEVWPKQVSYDIESIQVMDINDVPLHPRYQKHYYEDVAYLFGRYLPQFLCPKDSVAYDLFPSTYQTPLIYNLECDDCSAGGCHVTHDLCESTDCNEAFCKGCNKNKEHSCNECEQVMCDSHMQSCCGNNWCEEHILECNDCGSAMCPNCSYYVECCEENVCQSCSTYCDECSKSYCDTHGDFDSCEHCEESACRNCRESWLTADCCEKRFSDRCHDNYLATCSQCDWKICSEHEMGCEVCSRVLCENHAESCQECHYSTYCEEHLEAQTCATCDSHTHDWEKCKDCGVPMCEGHGRPCRGCGGNVCPEHANNCDCKVGKYTRITPHTYCNECLPKNICPVCQTTFCVPERHLTCAYTPRRKLRRRNPRLRKRFRHV